jgi:nucleotide sugar dehydrogenase
MAHAGLTDAPAASSFAPDVRGAASVRRHQRAGTVAVVGLGYVGLPTALALADAGRPVIGIDASPARLDAVRAGAVDLVRSDHDRLARLVDDPLLWLTADSAAIGDASAVLICVPTPVDDNLGPDLAFVRQACDAVVAAARPGQTIVLTSTTYVGCTRDLLVEPLRERGLHAGRDVAVVFSPERIDPANTTYTQDKVPRVVGGVTPSCAARAAAVLGAVAPCIHTVSSPEAAELTKLLENTFRAVNIALANEFADISGALGLDAREVIDAAATKPYGFMPFYPGPGVGGHCIPCDPHYLLWQLRADRMPAPVIAEAMQAISMRPTRVVQRAGEVLSDAGRGLRGARVLVVGVAYKPGVADVRESPAVPILAGLAARGAEVAYWDPLVPSLRMPDGTVLPSVDDPVGVDADLVLVHTLHPASDHDWIDDETLVLDATYRLDELSRRAVP